MFERITLPYDYADLEPVIDQETMHYHYDKHHKTYTDKFNELVEKVPEFRGKAAGHILKNLDKAPDDVRTGLKNNGGGFYNHNLYFESLAPGGKKPSTALKKEIAASFESFDKLLEKLHTAATATLFGSGYAWLVAKDDGLSVVTTQNQDIPWQKEKCILLLPVDMWEHAYYLKHKNAKADHVKELFTVVNWEKVEERLEESRKKDFDFESC